MRKNFPDEVRKTVSHDKPKKRSFASRDIAKEYIVNVLPPTIIIWLQSAFGKIGSHLEKSGQF